MELETIRGETAKHEQASHDYAVTGSNIRELATSAHRLELEAGVASEPQGEAISSKGIRAESR